MKWEERERESRAESGTDWNKAASTNKRLKASREQRKETKGGKIKSEQKKIKEDARFFFQVNLKEKKNIGRPFLH
jgi:hypothetical protein